MGLKSACRQWRRWRAGAAVMSNPVVVTAVLAILLSSCIVSAGEGNGMERQTILEKELNDGGDRRQRSDI